MTGIEFRGGVADALLITVLAVLAILALMKVWDAITPFDDRVEIHEKENYAYAVQRGGVIVGQALATKAAVSTYDPTNMLAATLWLVGQFVYVGLALLVTRWVLDKVVLPKVGNTELLRQRNLGVGLMEAAFYIAVGLLLGGSLTGSATTVGLTVASSIVFFVLGLALLVGYWWAYELATPGDSIRDRLIGGSVGAGIESAGVMLAAGIVIQNGVAGDFSDWGKDLGAFAATSVIGLVLMLGAQLLLNKFGPGKSLKSARNDDSVAHHAFLASLLVGIALVTASTVFVSF